GRSWMAARKAAGWFLGAAITELLSTKPRLRRGLRPPAVYHRQRPLARETASALPTPGRTWQTLNSSLSALAFEQNVRQTRQAVEVLKGINASVLVEGEIGDIGTGSEIHARAPDFASGLTTPDDGRHFVEATGVDILAPAVCNMHGMLESKVHRGTRKRLNIE